MMDKKGWGHRSGPPSNLYRPYADRERVKDPEEREPGNKEGLAHIPQESNCKKQTTETPESSTSQSPMGPVDWDGLVETIDHQEQEQEIREMERIK